MTLTTLGSEQELDSKLFDNCRKLLGSDMGKSVSIDDALNFQKMLQGRSPINNEFAKQAMVSMGGGKTAGGFPDLQPFFEEVSNKLGIGEMLKEIDFSGFTNAVPSSLGFNMFDLSGPARMTYPYLAPFRQRIPREEGTGPAALAKVITGVTGSGTGGVTGMSPFFKIQAPKQGNNPEGARGNAISYAQADVIVPYKFSAIYDSVMWTAFWAGRRFQDLTALSATVLLQVGQMLEDQALMLARDTALAVPAAPSGTERAALSGKEIGILDTGGSHTNCYIKVSAVGPFGETAASPSVTVALTGGTRRVVDITITDVPGAYGYNVYVSLADNGGADPGDASRFFYGRTGFNRFTIGVNDRVSSGPTSPTVDSGTGDSDAYRGIMPTVEFGPVSGTNIVGISKRLNARPTGNSVTFLQQIAAQGWDQAKANYDELWLAGRERQSISDLLQAAGTAPQRITIDPAQQGGIIAGAVVTSWFNEVTGKLLNMNVWPWMPVGNMILTSWALPFPTAEGDTNTVVVRGPQDYVQTAWPPGSFRSEYSLSWFNAPVVYGPTFFAVIHGVAQNDEVTTNGAMQ